MTPPTKARVQSPEVAEFAETHKVDLSAVNGTGKDGRITRDDAFRGALVQRLGLPQAASDETIYGAMHVVMAQKRRRDEADAQRAAASARQPLSSSSGPVASSAAQAAARRGGAYALNPLVAEARASGRIGSSAAANQAPTLFAAGDAPAFTASGIPPESVFGVPWQARHAVAAAPTSADAYAIVSECAGADGETWAAAHFGGDDANLDYAQRVQQWRVDSMTDDELFNSVSTTAQAEHQRRLATREVSDEQAEAMDVEARQVFGV